MSSPNPRRRVGATAFVALLTLSLAACAASVSPSASPGQASPPASAVAPSGDAGPAIDVDTLLGDAANRDGQVVRVIGNFLAEEGLAQLCAVFMESYPPQCGGGVRLTGEVPADTLARLTTTTEPNLKKMWWGYVIVEGTFRASGVEGQPTIELGEIVIQEG